MNRAGPERDRMIVGVLHTIATRTWEPPTGAERDAVLARLAEVADGRTDLLIEAAGVLLGVRPDDEHDSRHRQASAGAVMLLEVADVAEDDERVQRWIPEGRRRRDGWRRPEPRRDW